MGHVLFSILLFSQILDLQDLETLCSIAEISTTL